MKTRLAIVFSFFGLLLVLLFARATFLQIIPNERFAKLQARLFHTTVHLEPRRGAIMDRNGRDLGISVSTQSLYADPKIMREPRKTSRQLAKLMGIPANALYAKFKDKSKRFVWIQRRLPAEVSVKVKALNIEGLGFVEEWKRIYPNDSLLSQTLGFVNSEGHGLEGLELAYQEKLKGDPRKVLVRRDARGRPLMTEALLFTEHPEGHEIQLTVDSEIQFNLESELANVVREFDADSAVGVILDVKTSAIRAMGSYPTFDLNEAATAKSENRRNRVVTDAFEPGSTMKTFVIAAGLREKILTPTKTYFCENGSMKIGDRVIREAESDHRFANLSVTQILALSSNVGTTKIAFELGDQKLEENYEIFGFGSKSGIDLPGETRGIVQPLPWRPHLLSNISFGHGIAASSLQIANAYAALINGGSLNQPFLIQGIRDSATGKMTEHQPKMIRQVLTANQSAQMRTMLTAVTSPGGTGTSAGVNGFLVGGKTGTAQKVNPNAKGYLPGGYISNFAGFIPAENPRYVIYVAVDHPKKAYYGAMVAAPLFSRIASFVARKEGMAPSQPSDNQIFLSKRGRKDGPVAKIAEIVKSKFAADTAGGKPPEALRVMPELTNDSVRELIEKLQPLKVQIEINGSGGVVRSTRPAAGESLDGVEKVTVQLE